MEQTVISLIEEFNYELISNQPQGKAWEIFQTWDPFYPFSFTEKNIINTAKIKEFLEHVQFNCYYRLFNQSFDFCVDQGTAFFQIHETSEKSLETDFFLEKDDNRSPGLKIPKNLVSIKGYTISLPNKKSMIVFKSVVGEDNGNT
jgi:hypothetical protein